MRIGELAHRAGVSVETLRYYERRGLLPPAPRSPAGYRCYDSDALVRLRFIRRAQRAGFALDEIDELLALRCNGKVSCDEVRQRAESKLAELGERIRGLQRLQKGLRALAADCHAGPGSGTCPLLDRLVAEDD